MKNRFNSFANRIFGRDHSFGNLSKQFPNRRKFQIPFMFIVILFMSVLVSCENAEDPAMNTMDLVTAESGNSSEIHARHHDFPSAEIARLRAAVAEFHNIEKAMQAGYNIQASDYDSQMGYHYLNGSLFLDGQFELEKPEVLLFAPKPNGEFRLVGVEYIVYIEDLNNPPPPPEGFTGDADTWTINEGLSLWTLHVWVGLQNPDGIFTAHNPRLP